MNNVRGALKSREADAVLYRPSQAAGIPAMAEIRALEWGDCEYWMNRIAGYLEGEIHPQRALRPQRLTCSFPSRTDFC